MQMSAAPRTRGRVLWSAGVLRVCVACRRGWTCHATLGGRTGATRRGQSWTKEAVFPVRSTLAPLPLFLRTQQTNDERLCSYTTRASTILETWPREAQRFLFFIPPRGRSRTTILFPRLLAGALVRCPFMPLPPVRV